METESDGGQKLASRIDIDRLREPKFMAGAAFLAGIAIGLLVLGWWLFPVQWTDASPEHLRSDLQQDYLRMAIDSYSVNADGTLATARLDALGSAAEASMQQIAAAPAELNSASVNYFESQLGIEPALSSSDEQQLVPDEEALTEEEPSVGSQSLLLTMCSITALLGVALAGIYYFRTKQGGLPSFGKRQDTEPSFESSATLDALGDTPPISQWMTTYLMGDDLFDDSFSIDSSNGEFLGECGVGIAETVGVGDPKRVSSFELWLFDKNDIQTVTKVLMSNHTHSEDATRERLAAKGEPILAKPGTEAVLETETLQLIVRVVDMEYGEGAMPEESYFDRVTLELAVWSKQ
jgi:hypothetical protein